MIITSVSDFRANCSKFLKQAFSDSEVLILTRHGKPAVIILSYDKYKSIAEQVFSLENACGRFANASFRIAQGLDDALSLPRHILKEAPPSEQSYTET